MNSCAIYWDGSISSSLAIPPHQYHPVKWVNAKETSIVILYLFGGANLSNMVEETKHKLIAQTHLDSNQVLGDWSVSFKKQDFVLWEKHTCEVRASVISLVPVKRVLSAQSAGNQTEAFHNLTRLGKKTSVDELVKGDVVYFKDGLNEVEGMVQSMNGTTIKIKYFYHGNIDKPKYINKFKKDIYLKP